MDRQKSKANVLGVAQDTSYPEYREATELFIKVLKDYYAIEYWIMDCSMLMPISEQTIRSHLFSLVAVVNSLTKVACIIAKDVPHGVLLENIVGDLKNHSSSSVEIEQFSTYKEAADWIGMIRA